MPVPRGTPARQICNLDSMATPIANQTPLVAIAPPLIASHP